MERMLKLSEAVHTALEKAAQASGTTPEGWIVSHLADQGNGLAAPSDEQIAQANASLEEFVVHDDLGFDQGGDNERIDADLARTYQEHCSPPPMPRK
jgi:hypothetical protein